MAQQLKPGDVSTTKLPQMMRILTTEELNANLLQIPNLIESENREQEHVLIYGAPGTTKTMQAGLLSEFYNILWFDGDKGLTTLYHNLHPEMQKRIHSIRIPDSTMYPVMVGTMLKVITGRQVNICLEHGGVDCGHCTANKKKMVFVALNQLPKNWIVVMDSQSQMVASALALSYYKVMQKKIGDQDVDDFWREEVEKDDAFSYWAGVKNIMDKFGNYVKDLECKFVAISHETQIDKAKTDGGGAGKELVPVSGSDNSSRLYGKNYGTMVHAKKENYMMKYSTSVTSSNDSQQKSRTNVRLEEKIVPGLIHIFQPKAAEELLKGSYTEWYFNYGWKPMKDRKIATPPMPKGVLAV